MRFYQIDFVRKLLLLIPLIGLIIGLYLVQNATNYRSKATTSPIVFKQLDDTALPINADGVPQITIQAGLAGPTVKIELISPLGPAIRGATPQSFFPSLVKNTYAQTTSTAVTIRTWGQPANGYPRIGLYDGNKFLAQYEVKATSKQKADTFAFTFPPGQSFTQKPLVRFGNDLYKPPLDRNVFIDYIEVNGLRYESEDSRTLSNGSWTQSNGCGAGYKHQEGLHCNGFFRFDGFNVSIPTLVPTSTPTPIPTSTPTPAPTLTPITTDYKIAENPLDLDSAAYQPYIADPTVLTYQFKDNTLGLHFIWVDFKDSTGKVERKIAQIEFIAAPTPTPSSIPSPSPSASYRVFVTSTTYNGNLGGLEGADTKCQDRATAANLGGTWKAWIGNTTDSPRSRFTINTSSPFVLLNGTAVANNWADLTDGNLQNPIQVDEFGNKIQDVGYYKERVWTNTQANGQKHEESAYYYSCKNWIAKDFNSRGRVGFFSATSPSWTNSTADSPCGDSPYTARLYCFEQDNSPILPSPTPTSSPTPTTTQTKRVFVTSNSWLGASLKAADPDYQCAYAAQQANLGGNWISSLNSEPSSYGSYKMLNGSTVGKVLNITENGTALSFPSIVWVKGSNNCSELAGNGTVRQTSDISFTLTQRCDSGPARLFCFEQ